jgi:hypothetical protein
MVTSSDSRVEICRPIVTFLNRPSSGDGRTQYIPSYSQLPSQQRSASTDPQRVVASFVYLGHRREDMAQRRYARVPPGRIRSEFHRTDWK